MSYTLQITDGVDTVDLSKQSAATYGWIREYWPQDAGAATVTETALVVLKDASLSAVQTTKDKLERLLQAATRRAQGLPGLPVYIKRNFTGATQRSLLTVNPSDPDGIAGKLEFDENLYKLGVLDYRIEFGIIYTRVNRWDADTAVEITTATTGDDIYNHYDSDSGHVNYVDVAAANIGGSVPGPVELRIKNTFASNTLAEIWVGVNQHKGTAMPVHVLEGELATGMTEVVDTNSSAGKYGKYQLDGTSQQLAARWTLDTTALGKFAGHPVHVLMRAPVSNVGIYTQLKIMYVGTTGEIGIAPAEVLLTADGILDLGIVRLPNLWESETDYYNIDLCLYARGTDDAWIYCDCLYLMPVDCWRKYSPMTGGMAQNAVLHDEAELGLIYVDGLSTTQRSAHYVAEGKPLMLIPNQDARFIFVFMNTASASEIARTSNIRAWHRPAYLTL